MKVLFVCSGNTCRSPMAMALARQMHPEWEVRSAGIYAFTGQAMSANMRIVLSEEGILLDHTAKKLLPEDLRWADHVFVMDEGQKSQVLDILPHAPVRTLCEDPVLDPYGGSLTEYESTLEQMRQCLRRIQL